MQGIQCCYGKETESNPLRRALTQAAGEHRVNLRTPFGDLPMGDAATEFFGQANEFNSSLGAVMGSWATELVMADVYGKQANMGFLESLLVDPKGNPKRCFGTSCHSGSLSVQILLP